MDVSKYYNTDFRQFSDQYIFGYVQGFYFPDNPDPSSDSNAEFSLGFKDGAYDKKNNIWKFGITDALVETANYSLSFIKSYVRGFLKPNGVPISQDENSVNGYRAGEQARKKYVTINTDKSVVYDFDNLQSIYNNYLLGYLQGILFKDDDTFELGDDNVDFNEGFVDGRYDAKNNSLRYLFQNLDLSIFETKNLEYKGGFIDGYLRPNEDISEFGEKNYTKNYKTAYDLGRSYANGENVKKNKDMNTDTNTSNGGDLSHRGGEQLDPELCAMCLNSVDVKVLPLKKFGRLAGYYFDPMHSNMEGCKYEITSKIGQLDNVIVEDKPGVVYYPISLAGQTDTLILSMGNESKTITLDVPTNTDAETPNETTNTDTNTDTEIIEDNPTGLTLQMALDSGYTLEQLEKMGLYNSKLSGRGILGSLLNFLGLDVVVDMVEDFFGKNWNFMNEDQKYDSMISAYKNAVANLENNIKVRNGIYYTEMSKLLNYFIAYGKAAKSGSSRRSSIDAQRRFISFAEAKYNAFLASLPAGLEYRVVSFDFSEMEVQGLLYRGWGENQKRLLQGSYVQYVSMDDNGHYGSRGIGFTFPMWLMFIPVIYFLFFNDDSKKRKRGKKYGKRVKR